MSTLKANPNGGNAFNPLIPSNYRIYGAVRDDPSFTVKLDKPVTLKRRFGTQELLLKPDQQYTFKGTTLASNRWRAVYMHDGWSYEIAFTDLMRNGEMT